MNTTRTILKESLQFFDLKADKWTTATLCVKSSWKVYYKLNAIKKEIDIGPLTTTTRPKKGNFNYVFVINTVNESAYETGPRFACKELENCERWIRLLNLVALKKRIATKHVHPLTNIKVHGPVRTKALCKICGANTTSDPWVCEFCDFAYNECSNCHKGFQNVMDFVKSSNHPHPLMRLEKASGPWISSGYNGRYECDVCDASSSTTVYHCVECDEYDECPQCAFKPAPVLGPRPIPTDAPAPLTLDLKHLKPVLQRGLGWQYKLRAQDSKCPQNMSVITAGHWDLDRIETDPAAVVYMEVTFHEISPTGLVGVGIGNQIFAQNQLLGHQQNSIALFNYGQVCRNSAENSMPFFNTKFDKGDTIGMGIFFDSFNQRTLFYTKNGVYVGYVDQRIHPGMDCFPGVSFTKDSKINFTVNFEDDNDFKFDLRSLRNEKTTKNWMADLPEEILQTVGAYAVVSDFRALQLRTVNKQFAKAMTGNTVWRSVFMKKWPSQNPQLKIKSWLKFYQTRKTVVDEKFGMPIDNCDWEFECPVLWDRLEKNGVSDAGERFCDKCKKTVFAVSDMSTLNRFVEMGRCVTFYKTSKNAINDDEHQFRQMRGRVAPPRNFVRQPPAFK